MINKHSLLEMKLKKLPPITREFTLDLESPMLIIIQFSSTFYSYLISYTYKMYKKD